MADITNQDIFNAIRGLYQNSPNKVTDATTQAKLDLVLAELQAIKSTTGIKKIADALDIADRSGRALGKITADDNAIAALGALAASAVTDPTTSANVIALLKGLLKQMQGTGSGAAPVREQGTYVCYSTDDKSVIAPNPERGDKMLELDSKKLFIYDGAEWVVFA